MTQVIFNLDPKVKAKAMKRAKREGIPFSAFLKRATQAFIDGEASLEYYGRIKPEKLKLLERASKALRAGKGRKFASAKEAQEFVENL